MLLSYNLYIYTECPVFQLIFTCSKSTVETLKKGVKYVEVNNKNTSGVFIVNFEHVESEQVYVSLLLLFLKSLIGIACPHYYSIMAFSVFVASLVNYFVLYWSSSNWFKKTIPCQFKFFDAINFSRQCIWKRES